MKNEINIDSIEKKVPGLKEVNKKLKPVLNYIEKNISKVFIILLIALLLIFILNIFSTSIASSTLKEKAELIKEFNKPIKIELVSIECAECYDITNILDSVKNQNVDILDEKNLDYNSAEARELISKYGIQKLPSIIITGEIDSEKIDFTEFELNDDALVLNKINAPYFDLTDNLLKGRTSIIEITDSSCSDCTPLTSIATNLIESGVLVSDWKKLEYNSAEGKAAISQYNIKQVPAILISNDVNYYDGIKEGLIALGVEEKQGFYAVHSTVPPYRDLTKNKIVGLVELIMLEDNSCSACYDVNSNKQILARLGLKINEEKTYDINSAEGKSLISKYSIQKVPLIILSPEAGEYDSFVAAWSSVGTEESDGWFIMRKPEVIGEIKQL